MGLGFFGLGRLFKRNGKGGTERHQAKATGSQGGRLKPNPGTAVLIVDDSRTAQISLAKVLARHGYETLAAYDGESGIELAASCKPAIIMMDVVMPGMTGFQATRRLRKHSDPAVAEIPIIIMSGNQQATEQFWSVKIGANDFMSKPFTPDEVMDRIERLLYPGALSEEQQAV